MFIKISVPELRWKSANVAGRGTSTVVPRRPRRGHGEILAGMCRPLRLTLRYAYGLMLEADNKPLREDEIKQEPLKFFNVKLTESYVAVRRELGIRNPERCVSEW